MATPVTPVAAAAPAPSAPVAAPAPAAPAAAPAPVSTPAPAAPSTPAGGAPAPVSAPSGTPAKYDPATSGAPPKSSDYSDDQEGVAQFISENTAWSMAHPEEAAKIRTDKLAAEEAGTFADTTSAEAGTTEAVQAAEGTPEPDAKPADVVPAEVGAATPVKIDEWTSKSPELKAAFEKNPELRDEIMGMARGLEAANAVTAIVSTAEEAQFAVDHANRLVTLQTNWMLSGEDPEMIGPAWDQTVEMFKERDANGAEVKGPDGKPVLGADFKPFVRKAASSAMEDFAQSSQSQITALEQRLAGNYATEDARAADTDLLKNAQYEKAAFDFVLDRLSNPAEAGAATLPALPPNATPEQVAFQKQLEAQQKDLDAKQGKQTVESRKSASAAVGRDVQTSYEKGINDGIEAHIGAMKERGEYLPEFVLTDKWVNPQTGQPTKVSAFGARIYLALNAKINANPLHAAKLGSLQALGAAGRDARKAELTRLTNLYMPNLLKDEVTRIQDGIRASNGQGKPAGASVARVEPQSQGTVVPSAMNVQQVRSWAEAEAAKQPGFDDMDGPTRETLIISLAAKKKYGG